MFMSLTKVAPRAIENNLSVSSSMQIRPWRKKKSATRQENFHVRRQTLCIEIDIGILMSRLRVE